MGVAPEQNLADVAYDSIASKASANSFIQGLTGVAGFPFTLAADVGSIPIVYVRMWNDIRKVYGHDEIGTEALIGIVKPLLPEVLADLALDKVLGNVPVVGIYFNAICAKALTWRLGTLFTFLSSRGSDIPAAVTGQAMELIREMFPQNDMFKFATPDRALFLDLVQSVAGTTQADFERKVHDALDALKK